VTDRQTDTDVGPLCAGGVYGRSSPVSLCGLLGAPGAPGQEQVGASLTEDGVSSGDRRAVGSRLQVLGPYAAKQQSRRPSLGQVQGTRE